MADRNYTAVLIADPIVLNNRDRNIYHSDRSPEQIIKTAAPDSHFVEGPIPDIQYPDNAVVFSYRPQLTPAQISDAVSDGQFDGIIVAAKLVQAIPGKETRPDGSPFLKFAVRIGAGTNNVLPVHAAGGNIMNTPGFNSLPTAQAMVGALNQMLSPDELKRQSAFSPTDIYLQTMDVMIDSNYANSNNLSHYYHGGWPAFKGTKPEPKRVAIIGPGHIGGLVSDMLQADGHAVVAYSRSLTPEKAKAAGMEYAATVLEAARNADVIIVQTPLTDATRGIISEEVMLAAKPNVVLVNAGRSELVDTAALRKLLAQENSHIGGLIVDVDHFPGDPKSPMQPYIDAVRASSLSPQAVILTPHTFADTHSPSREAGASQAISQAMRAIAIERGSDAPHINLVNARPGQISIVEDGLKPNPASQAALKMGGTGEVSAAATAQEKTKRGV